MSTTCYQGVTMPELQNAPCNGEYRDDNCILHALAIPELNALPNTSVGDIIEKIKTALVAQNIRTQGLESVLANPPVNNTTLIALTLPQLNTTYPLATIGFEVQCLTILKIYKKTISGWAILPITLAT